MIYEPMLIYIYKEKERKSAVIEIYILESRQAMVVLKESQFFEYRCTILLQPNRIRISCYPRFNKVKRKLQKIKFTEKL